MKNSLILTTFAAALMSMPNLSLAQEGEKQPPPPPPPGAEGRPERRNILQQLDTDGDGKVSKEEYLQNATKEAERRFENVDANKDGVIEQAEFDEAARRLRESGRGVEGRRPGPGGPGGPGDRPGGFRRPGPPEGGEREGGFRRPDGEGGPGPRRGFGGGFGGGEFMRGLDANEDGEITKEEFQASNDKRFEQLDINKDGKITREELEEFANRLRSERGPRGDRGNAPREGNAPAPESAPAPAPAPAPAEP